MPAKTMQIALTDELVRGIDQYRRRYQGEVPSKAQCVRELIATALKLDELEAVQ
jgi:hypothetical protein